VCEKGEINSFRRNASEETRGERMREDKIEKKRKGEKEGGVW